MTSFFGFSSSSTSTKLAQSKTLHHQDDTQLDITITPASAAFYAGETFSVTITFTCSRKPSPNHLIQPPNTPLGASSTDIRTPTSATRADLGPALPVLESSTDGKLPRRKGQIGLSIDTPAEKYNAEAGPSRLATPMTTGYMDSPAGYASPYSPGANPGRGWPRSGSPPRDGIPGGVRSPEVMRRPSGRGSVGGGRRTQSLALGKGMSPQEMVWALGSQATPPLPTRRSPGSAQIPSSHPHSRKISVASQPQAPSPSQSTIDLSEPLESIPESATGFGPDGSRSRPQQIRNPSSSSTSSSATHSQVDLMDDTTPRHRPNIQRRPISEMTLSPPPSHPYIRSLAEPRETTILWAQTRLVAHFHPSTAYIPPDPLLPLRSLLLHQPIGAGSGSLTSSTSTPTVNGSRWQLSFGTGTIGHETKPSLTGSLVGLASSLVYGGSAGSLEEDRKKAWNTKDLPVLETARSLLGVDIKLKEGEKREFVYTFPIPMGMPPTHRGRAFRFGWDFVLSLAVADGTGVKGGIEAMRTRDIEVPIRVWNHVALGAQPSPYDVLKPVIQIQDQATVTETTFTHADSTYLNGSRDGIASSAFKAKSGDTRYSLDSYAHHLLETLSDKSNQPRPRAPSPSFEVSPSLMKSANPSRSRKGSFIQGDEELVEEGGDGDGCDQAVEILSRHSTKASYDIAKDGDLVSVLTLLKTTYRLGETVLGVITINPPPDPTRHVLKFSAYLESDDLIPVSLLPPSPRGGVSSHPTLVRTHTDFSSGYVNQTQRLAFNLDIPSDATPGFSFGAGEEKGEGGVEWKIRLAFLVSAPLTSRGERPSPMLVSAKEGDNKFYTANPSLAPVILVRNGEGKSGGGAVEEMETETVECEIPIKVLPGNNTFKIRPAVYTV